MIALADIGGVWDVMQVTGALTDVADTAVDAALRYLLGEAARAGNLAPRDPGDIARDCGLIVLAMGKMGARELNYSSDIDLMVFFDPNAAALASGVEPGPFFVRMTQRLIQLLQERTEHGYVFRVDMRLRPDPASTQVAISVPAALDYYESRGQQLGARRAHQGTPMRRRRCRRRGTARQPRALRLAQISRFRGACRRPRNETANSRLSRPRRGRGRRPQHQARTRRHSRDRVLRPDPATHRRRPQSAIAQPRDPGHAARARRRWLDRRQGTHRP